MSKEKKKVKVQCTEMADADVQFISLVPRGAIRVPFRILKEDKSMSLDLGSLFRRAKKEEVLPPVIAAVVVSKETDLDDLTGKLTEAGFTVVKADETGAEANILVLDDSASLDQGTVVKMNDDLAVVVYNVAKTFDPWANGSSFGDNMKAAGFFPGLYAALDVLGDTVRNILWETESGGSPVAAVSKAVNEFGSYIEQLAAAIPQTAFKMEKIQVVKKEVEEGTGATEEATTEGAEGTAEGTEGAAEGTGEAEGTVQKNEGEEETSAGTETPADESTSEPGMLTSLMDQMKQVFETTFAPALQTVTAKMEEVTTEIASVKEQVAAASALAKKADEAVSGTVHAEAPAPSRAESLVDTGLVAAKKQDGTQTSTFGDAFKFPGLED